MSSTTTPNSAVSQTSSGGEAAKGIKGVFASVHGAGETLRGAFNGAVDDTFNAHGGQNEGITRNNAVTEQGMKEMETGQFSANTKAKETTNSGRGI